MTQTNQLEGTARENPHTFASPYHGTDFSKTSPEYCQHDITL
jgi:hypothetical protein